MVYTINGGEISLEPEQKKNRDKLVNFTTILASQIQMYTRSGLNDLSTIQESSLLPLINHAWGENFENMNKVSQNYPGLDYGQLDKRLGLQMTASVAKKKYKKTLEKLRNNMKLKGNFNEIWFFVLTVERLPDNVREYPDDFCCKYYTLYDLVEMVMAKPLEFQREFLTLAQQEYSDYFFPSGVTSNQGYSLSENLPIPVDLGLFNALVETNQWFDSVIEGERSVHEFLELFKKKLRQCTLSARSLLSKIISEIDKPENISAKIEFPERLLYGPLSIDDINYPSFLNDLDNLSNMGLIERWDNTVGMYSVGDDAYFETERMICVEFKKFEPEMNLYAALYIFYKIYHDINKLVFAIENNDFSLLADDACQNLS
ncbi:TPA: SMEK domain-containing protein [Morganella morganii]